MVEKTSRKERILILDDEPEITYLLARTLRLNDYEVDAVNTPGLAFTRLWDRPYQLFISDVMMPGMDGVDVLRVVRADEKLADMPVIILSAKTLGPEEMALITGRLRALVVRKPFSPQRLVKVARRMIADREGTLKSGLSSGALELL